MEHFILSDTNVFDTETAFVKDVYTQVKNWLDAAHREKSEDSMNCHTLVILDDASTLSTLVGERLTYGLILSLCALSKSPSYSCGFAIRCMNDCDIEAANLTVPRTTDWFGVGSGAGSTDTPPWERSLVELSDTVVDVVPLASGYSREAHGRLNFTRRTADTTARQTSVFNYCLTDNQVLAIRIGSPSRLNG